MMIKTNICFCYLHYVIYNIPGIIALITRRSDIKRYSKEKRAWIYIMLRDVTLK